MFSVPEDNTMLSDRKMPGSGKRSMPPPPPPPTNKKQLKKLNLHSKNPLLSGNTRMEGEENPWQVSLLEASEDDFQFGEEKEFDIPLGLGLEAFAEKIGLGSSQDPEFSDTEETPGPGVVTPSPPPTQFHDYAMPPSGPEEEVWGDLSLVSVSPMEVEGRQFIDPLADIEQKVNADTTMNSNNNQGKMNQMTHEEIEKIRKSENTTQLTEADINDLEFFLSESLDSLLNSNEPMTVNEAQNFDIVEFAMGESGVGLDEDEKLTEVEPTKTTMDTDEDYIPDLKKIKTEPREFVEMKPVENVSIEVIEETPRRRKRRVGRPVNNNPITITEIPVACKLSDNELRALKYQRTRELNNKASRRFRLNKKKREEQSLQELEQLRAQNHHLQQTLDSMEKEVALWKEKVSGIKQ